LHPNGAPFNLHVAYSVTLYDSEGLDLSPSGPGSWGGVGGRGTGRKGALSGEPRKAPLVLPTMTF